MTDNELLEHFFLEARQYEVADNGFSQRVMQQLPRRDVRGLSRLWTAFCVTVAVVLFALLRGWELIAYGLLMIVNNMSEAKSCFLTATVLAGVFGLMALVDTFNRERLWGSLGR